MFSLFVRQALARRPALNTLTRLVGRLPTLSSSPATLAAAASPRFFSLSTPLAFPAAKKTTTTKKTPAKKTVATAGGKKTATKPATKKKTASARKPTTKKIAPKKKVVAAAKPKKTTPKKVVPKRETPWNTPRLRPPPRQMPAFGVFYQRMYPTLEPKPANIKDSFLVVQKMWGALNEAEKDAFRTEARDISAQRKLVYDKWRHSLTPSEVLAINKYRRTPTKSRKARTGLGRDALSTKKGRTLNPFLKFLGEMRTTGQIDPNTAPEGVNKAVWMATQAGARWRAMTEAQKKAYT